MEPPPLPPPDGASVLTDYDPPEDRDRIGLHLGLFALTFVSMVWAGGWFAGRGALWQAPPEGAGTWGALLSTLTDPVFLSDGATYAVAFLSFLTVHEFGHYLTARWWKTRVSLPYYIPVPIPLPYVSLGTMGAVIRIREPLRRTRQLFDIGAAGPLAGFVVAVGVLLAAVLTLPPVEYLADVGHAADVAYYQANGELPPFVPEEVEGMAFVFGDTPLFRLLGGLGAMQIPGHEVMHYPLLLAGWLGLFFTALNLLPVGQLDGGHVVYALFGAAVHRVVARIATLVLTLSGVIGLARIEGLVPEWAVWPLVAALVALVAGRVFAGDWRLMLAGTATLTGLAAWIVEALPGLAARVGWTSWLFWVALILFLIRVDHPPVRVEEPLTPGRTALGVLCLVIFALCFSIQPIQIVGG